MEKKPRKLKGEDRKTVLWTIGHSNRSKEAFQLRKLSISNVKKWKSGFPKTV